MRRLRRTWPKWNRLLRGRATSCVPTTKGIIARAIAIAAKTNIRSGADFNSHPVPQEAESKPAEPNIRNSPKRWARAAGVRRSSTSTASSDVPGTIRK